MVINNERRTNENHHAQTSTHHSWTPSTTREKEKPYEVIDTYQKSRKIVDEQGKDVWVSGAAFRKYFYEEREQ